MGNFKTKLFGGYSQADVDARLKTLEDEKAALQKSLEEAQTELADVKEELAIRINRDEVTRQTNEEIARLALKEASSLIDKAKRNANMILKESMEYVRGLETEVGSFKDEARDFRAQVEKLSDELLKTIDKSELFSLIKEEQDVDGMREAAEQLVDVPETTENLSNTETEDGKS